MKLKSIFFVLFISFILNSTRAQVSITALPQTYSQTFDAALGTSSLAWTNNATVIGWYISNASPLPINTGTTNANSCYNFGISGTNPLTDRALGAISTTTTHRFGLRMANNSGSSITSFNINFTGEQWRSFNAGTLVFEYQTGATVSSLTAGTWTALTALNFASLTTSAGAATDGNNTSFRTAKSATLTLTVATATEIFFRWTKAGTSSPGLAIDDLSITANGTFLPTLTVSPTTLTGFSYVFGSGPSASQSYNLSGILLTGAPGNITITESTDYEVSSDNISFGASASIPYTSATLAATTVYIRLKAGRAIGTYNGQLISNAGGGATTENVTCSGNVPTPLLTASPTSLSGFTYVLGAGPSTSQSYNLSGTNLSGAPGNITITESSDYEVSSDDISFGASATIPYASATLASTPVYVRLKAGRAVATYNGQTIANDGGSASSINVTCNGSVVGNSISSDIITFNGESASISSVINTATPLTSATGMQVWQFKVRDGGATLNDADAVATILTDFTISQAAGNAISNWSSAIRTIELFDGSTNLGVGVVTTAPNQITFTGLSASVADNAEKIYSLRLSLNCGIGATNDDGEDFGFQISNGNVTFSPTGSGKFAFPATSTTNGQNVITVVATQLAFVQQPTNTGQSQAMLPTVTVKATDACGNTDLGYTGTINITSTGTLTGTTVTAAAITGLASYSTLTHTAVGTGYTLTAAASGLTSVVSSTFDISLVTVFGVGDIAIVGMCVNMDGCSGGSTVSEDEISFVSFEDITPGTTIDLTDNGFERLNCGSNTWGNTEGVIRITRNSSTIPKGTIITLRILDQTIFTPVQPDANWTVSYPNSGYGTFNMNSNDEQIYILQGGVWNKNTSSAHDATYVGGTLMFAINTYTTWTCNGSSTQRGELPLLLKCFSILPGIATKNIKYTGITTPASQKDWIDRLNSASNWTGYPTCAAYLSGGLDYESPQAYSIISSGFSSGFWTGASNSDWYDCNNWQNYKVPDSLVNVTIDNVTNDPIIGASPLLYPNGAICNNLLITGTSGPGILTLNNILSHFSIKGNTTNNGIITSTNGLTNLRSANAQTISGSGTTSFYNLRLINSNASGVTLAKPIATSGTLTFTNGLLTTTATNILTMSAGSVASSAYNSSFVNGPVKKTGSTDFIFPVGKDAVYRPISATALTGSETFTAEYFHADPDGVPYDVTSKDATLDDIGRCEYWILNRAGTVDANVTLSWDTYSCGVTSLPDLAVARWDGSMWKDHGNGGTTGTTSSGSVISNAAITSFSPFTLASKLSGVNPLPIELLDFTANYKTNNNQVELNWTTASETNNDYYTIERSADIISFDQLSVTDGGGNSTSILNYSATDDSPVLGVSYYRLKQTDFDGNYSYSNTVSVQKDETIFEIISTQYNFLQNKLSLYFNCSQNCFISLELYDMTGKKVHASNDNALGSDSKITLPTKNLSEGIYLIKAYNGKTFISKKIKI